MANKDRTMYTEDIINNVLIPVSSYMEEHANNNEDKKEYEEERKHYERISAYYKKYRNNPAQLEQALDKEFSKKYPDTIEKAIFMNDEIVDVLKTAIEAGGKTVDFIKNADSKEVLPESKVSLDVLGFHIADLNLISLKEPFKKFVEFYKKDKKETIGGKKAEQFYEEAREKIKKTLLGQKGTVRKVNPVAEKANSRVEERANSRLSNRENEQRIVVNKSQEIHR